MSDMADQFDDGRYDSAYTVLPGGWCVPNHMAPEPFYTPGTYTPDAMDPGLRALMEHPIPAQRGGIKYPNRKTDMPSYAYQIAALEKEQERLAEAIATVKQRVKQGQRKAPPAGQYAWTIDVRFQQDGKLYEFLILRVNGMFYTTGSGDTAFYRTWADLLAWLDSVDSHSALIPMRTDSAATAPLEGRQ